MSHGKEHLQPETIIRGLTRDELESLILSQLETDNRALASEILARFGNAENDEDWRTLVRQCLDHHSSMTCGFIDDANRLVWDLEDLRKRAKSFSGKDKETRAFELYRAIIETIAPCAEDADDHDGVLLGAVSGTLHDIRDLAQNRDTPSPCLADMRIWARSAVASHWGGSGYGWDFDLFDIAFATCRSSVERDSWLAFCEARCAVTSDDLGVVYRAEKLGASICERLTEAGDSVGLGAFIGRHPELDSVRDVAIRLAREAGDLDRALHLAQDRFESSKNADYWRSNDHYARIMLEIMDLRGDRTAALEFSIQRTIDTASKEWYQEIPGRIPEASDRKPVTDRILEAVAPRTKNFAAEILAIEKRWEELWVIATDDTWIMERYYEILSPHYPEHVTRWLGQTIRKEMDSATNRKAYQRVAARIPGFRRIAGSAAAMALVNELIRIHSNRPAMIQVLHDTLRARP